MPLTGKIQDVPLTHLLQVVAGNRSTGKLTINRRENRAVVIFRGGKIIYAATNGPRETIGNLLVMQRLVTVAALAEGLERQKNQREDQRLGSILVDMGALERDDLVRVMREQVEKVLLEMMAWNEGHFRFEALDLPERGEIEVDTREFLVREGLATERVLFDVMAQLGESEGRAATERAEELPQVPPELAPSLGEIMADIRSPRFHSEASLEILRHAARFFDRGAIFLSSGPEIQGMGHFGFEASEAGARVRTIRIPADEPSVFQEVLESHETYQGPLAKSYWNIYLAQQLGHAVPKEIAVLPMSVGDRPALLVYGDNLTSGRAIAPLDELELLLQRIGLRIEQSSLEEKIAAVEIRSRA